MNKQSVSQNVNACTNVVQKAPAEKAAEASRKLAILRTVLWADTLTIIVILILTFAVLYREIIQPLLSFAKLIPEEQPLDETRGVQEVRLVASAYNDVRKRRDSLDNILRSAAETDALTNLPNRYRFEQFLLEAEESGYPVAMLLFDVNYLKQTNDKYGHLAGDKLICTAAECIASCFGDNCFRFGGDEFAAIITGVSKEKVSEMMRKVEETEKAKNVSISFGCAYTDEIGQTSFRDLLNEADRKMYQQKEEIHHHALSKNLELKNAEA
jgi:diguanylate cyclase (GGDEF)-like protein